MTWDGATLELLDREREVRIVTRRPDDSAMRTTIWVVVADGAPYVRSWKGDRAHWFQAAIDRPNEVELVADGKRLEARAVPATDVASVARCSSALLAKYAGDPAARSMVRPAILHTTLRLDPR